MTLALEHRPRQIDGPYFNSVDGKPFQMDHRGPMGLRCLHPTDPRADRPLPLDARAYAFQPPTFQRMQEYFATCGFDDCVCVCHLGSRT